MLKFCRFYGFLYPHNTKKYEFCGVIKKVYNKGVKGKAPKTPEKNIGLCETQNQVYNKGVTGTKQDGMT